MLRADWALFLELVAYTLHGLSAGSVAFGIEEVTEAVAQAAVAVLFVPVGCGHGGEGAVRRVAAAGGRGYIVGLAHELHEDVAAWGASAILRQPLQRQLDDFQPSIELDQAIIGPPPKKQRLQRAAAEEAISVAIPKSAVFFRPSSQSSANGENIKGLDSSSSLAAATPKAFQPPAPKVPRSSGAAPEAVKGREALPAPVAPATAAAAPADPEREMRRSIKSLGKIEALQDKTAIPRFAESLREHYLPMLGASAVFSVLADAFIVGKGVAHRKAMVYAAHELLTKKRGYAMRVEDRRLTCLQRFFLHIGACIRGFRADERQSYCRLIGAWQKAKVFQPTEIQMLKEAWDVD